MSDNNEAIVKKVETEEERKWMLIQRQADCWSSSDLVPKQYQGKIANVIIALEVAKQINVSPLAVMQNLYIVHGRPAFEAKFLIAAANSSGKFSPLRYRFEGEEGESSWGCRAVAVDLASKEELVGPLITMKMAKEEDWTKNKKWQTMPELMLRYRSAAWWTRVYAPEISLGFQTTDEVIDVGPAQVVEVEQGESSLDAVTRALKAKREEPPPSKIDEELKAGRIDYLRSILTDRYQDKMGDVLLNMLEVRERMPVDLETDPDLVEEIISELEGGGE
jgi:hypothetical protein